jgi:hypothetical protein
MALNPDIFQGATFRGLIDENRAEGFAKGKVEGKAEGIAEGKAEGIAEGKAEGIAEGKAEGVAKSLLMCLDARGIGIDQTQRKHVATCSDEQILGTWLTRAFTANTANDVFEN